MKTERRFFLLKKCQFFAMLCVAKDKNVTVINRLNNDIMTLIQKITDYLEWLVMPYVSTEKRVMIVLSKVNYNDLKNGDKWYAEFRELVNQMHYYRKALKIIEDNKSLRKWYLDELEKSEEITRKDVLSCLYRTHRRKTDRDYTLVYPNLYFEYIQRWDISGSVRKFFTNSREANKYAIALYNMMAPNMGRGKI